MHILVAAVLGIVGPQEKIESTAGKERDVERGRLVCVRLLYDPFVEFGLIAACPDFEDIPQVVSLYVRYLFGYGPRLRGRRQSRSQRNGYFFVRTCPGSSSLLHDVKANAADNITNENNVNFFIELELLKR